MLVMSAKHHFREEHFNTVVELLEKAQQINPDGWGAKTLLAQAKQRL
jgi:Flp pilus assembly protein TadD